MKDYLEKSFSDEKITDELNNKESEFYLAVLDNSVIGYLKLNFGQAQTELWHSNAVEVERIYVLKEFQGRKAGQLLFEKALTIAKEKGAAYVWLGVWEENEKAIQFYRKNGFTEFSRHIFVLGDDRQTDIMMKLIL